MLGAHFEREIREQPQVWRAIADSKKAGDLARAIADREVLLLGSGSSLFMAQLGALALRQVGRRAHALAASEAPMDHGAYCDAAVIACSQSGGSTDLLQALDFLHPGTLIALTNTPDSVLAARASQTIDLACGPELAVPATKSVTATAAILLWTAALTAQERAREARELRETAGVAAAWLAGDGPDDVARAAQSIARGHDVAVLGSGYGVPIAAEGALKIKEASYMHAEGFSAGEFRHGSRAMLDASFTLIGILDEASRAVVERPLLEAAPSGALRYAIGARIGGLQLLGPVAGEAFNALAWLVCAQMLALYIGRARGVDSDAPRGLVKTLR